MKERAVTDKTPHKCSNENGSVREKEENEREYAGNAEDRTVEKSVERMWKKKKAKKGYARILYEYTCRKLLSGDLMSRKSRIILYPDAQIHVYIPTDS